jgi:nucleotide-binding universal stress UspA family protein
MKKVLFAADGKNFSEGAFEFVRRLNALAPITLTGVFLAEVNLSEYWNYTIASQTGVYMPEKEGGTSGEMDASIARFRSLCADNQITSMVHYGLEEEALQTLAIESRFTDLLVIGSQTFYEDMGGLPNAYLKEVLRHAECPVLLIPEKSSFPDSILFCYDGSASAMFAIRQFAYIFPELIDKPVSILYLGDREGEPAPNQEALMELMKRHFKNVKLLSLGENLKQALRWLNERENPLVVAGSYGRSSLSRMFSNSFVTILIHQHKIPLFIAHK